MTNNIRDYSLIGRNASLAFENDLAAAEWYHMDVSRKEIKELMERSDKPAIRDTVIWLGLMVVFAGIGMALWPSWGSAPFWLTYGILSGSVADFRWHEHSWHRV